MERFPCPGCGRAKPAFAIRDGACRDCRSDDARDVRIMMGAKHKLTWDDIRGHRRALLERTDWVEAQPERVAREPAERVAAIRAYRQELLDITETFPNPESVTWPAMPP